MNDKKNSYAQTLPNNGLMRAYTKTLPSPPYAPIIIIIITLTLIITITIILIILIILILQDLGACKRHNVYKL